MSRPHISPAQSLASCSFPSKAEATQMRCHVRTCFLIMLAKAVQTQESDVTARQFPVPTIARSPWREVPRGSLQGLISWNSARLRSNVSLMNCPRCQQTLNDDAQYCSSCGLSIAPFTSQTELLDPSVVKSGSDPLLGRIFDGKYELVALLGEGGMGAVYCACRLHIGDEVAVKLLRCAT